MRRSPISKSSRASIGLVNFKFKAAGCCFNCLASDHQVAQCRDFSRCWKCRKFGHISSSCSKTPSTAKRSPGSQPWVAKAPPSSSSHLGSENFISMDRRRSFGEGYSRNPILREADGSVRGSAINFPGNPRFRPRVAFKSAPASPAMDERKDLLSGFALRVKEEGPMGDAVV
jgi:hypothetical protein